MRKSFEYKYLPSYDKSKTRLRIVGGNPSLVTSAMGGNRKRFALIRGTVVAKKTRSVRPQQPSTHVSHKEGYWARLRASFNENQGVLTFVTILFVLVSAIFVVGTWYVKSTLREELKMYIDEAFIPIRKDLGEIRNDVVKLRAEVENIKGKLSIPLGIIYKDEVSALGITNPQIVPIQLSEVSSAGPPVITVEATFNDGATLRLDFRVERVTEDSIKFLINGVIRGRGLADVGVTLPRQVGVPIELNRVIPVPGMPKILLTLLDFPMKDTAVVAVGEKSGS